MALSNSAFAWHFPEDEESEFGVIATRHELRIDKDLFIPNPESDGKIPTLNQTGFMTPDQNQFNQDFIEFASQYNLPVLDIGAAYGLTSLPALEKGATVIANDIDPRHLLLLREQTTEILRSRLFLNKRRFPDATEFPDNSLGAILLCRVAHFLTGEEMEQATIKMTKWLAPGGRIYIVTMSPYHHLLRDKFLPIYFQKINQGVSWPGVIHNMHDYAPQLKGQIPEFLHVMDTDSLGKAFRNQGLKVLKEGFFDYTRKEATKSDDKGYYGIIVEKK